MKRHMILSLIIIAVLVTVPVLVSATSLTRSTSSYLTQSFGGKVLTPNLSIATCIGFGTGPVVLYNNVSSLASGALSAANSGAPAENRISGAVSGIYNAIPFYASPNFGKSSALPKAGDWILGRASIVPDFSRCFITDTPIPFPVRNTSNYQVSH